jgi:hypothetical protein
MHWMGVSPSEGGQRSAELVAKYLFTEKADNFGIKFCASLKGK